ncbi:MAG: hypothetical protein ACO22K_10035 [Woeseiaceae bacterium]|jgi:hypothetical protein
MFRHNHIVACSPRSGTTLLHEAIVTCFRAVMVSPKSQRNTVAASGYRLAQAAQVKNR